MLPPKNWLSTTRRETSARAAVDSSWTSGSSTCAPYSPVTMVTGAGVDGAELDRRGGGDARRAVAVGGRAVDPREEPGSAVPIASTVSPASAARTSASNERAMPMPFSCWDSSS